MWHTVFEGNDDCVYKRSRQLALSLHNCMEAGAQEVPTQINRMWVEFSAPTWWRPYMTFWYSRVSQGSRCELSHKPCNVKKMEVNGWFLSFLHVNQMFWLCKTLYFCQMSFFPLIPQDWDHFHQLVTLPYGNVINSEWKKVLSSEKITCLYLFSHNSLYARLSYLDVWVQECMAFFVLL